MADNATKILKRLNELLAENSSATQNASDKNKVLKSTLDELIAAQTQLANQQQKISGETKKRLNVRNELNASEKVAQQVERELIKTESLRAREQEKINRELLKTKTAQDKVKKSVNDLNGAYRKASKELTTARNKAKDLGQTYGVTSKQFRTASKDVRALDANLKRIDSRLGQSQRSVGNYGKAFSGLRGTLMSVAGALGFVGGIQLVTKAFKDGLNVVKNYEKKNAELAGVLGKQRKDLIALQKESKRLGATTAFTATEVTDLQIELARLGKTEQEIIASTEGIIDATIALGSETGETAALVGATLNAFQLAASDSSKVADILTLSTQRSALSFQKLNTALPIAGGAAAAAGVKLETVVAQLGQAADRGIDASTAATSLRNIYIELANKGITLESALRKINSSQDKLSTANSLFGKRAAVTALALAETTDKTNELTVALENAGGTAKRVAEEQLNTLDGALKLANSAYEGLIQTIFKTEGATKFVQGLTGAITNLTKAIKGSGVVGEELGDEILVNISKSSKSTEESIKRVNRAIDSQIESIEILRSQAPELSRLDLLGGSLTGGLSIKSKVDELNFLAEQETKTNETLRILRQELAILEKKLAEESVEGAEEANEEITSSTTKSINKQEEELKGLNELKKTLSADAADSAVKDWDFISGEAIKNTDEIDMSVRQSQQIFEDAERAKTQIAQEEAQKRKDLNDALIEAGFESAGILADQFFANGQQRRDEETQAQIDAMNQRLENDTLDAEQRELIQKQIAEKEKKLKTDQAKADKKAAIIQSVVNTALSIGKTAATIPFPAAIPFIAFAAATGLAQQIAIASQPLPKFDKGKKNTPGGGFWAGEKRPEFMIHKGVASLVDRPTLFGDDHKGAEIIGGAESARIIDQINRQQVIEGVSAVNNKGVNSELFNLAVKEATRELGDRLVPELRKNRPIKQDTRDWRADKSYNKFRN
jgi:hypothetical protein